MVWDTIKLGLRLMLVHLLTLIFSAIGLSVFMSSDLSDGIKLLVSAIFLAFWLGLIWDNATRRASSDTKALLSYNGGVGSPGALKNFYSQRYYPLKGFAAGAVAILPMLVLALVYTFMAYDGLNKGISPAVLQLMYLVLNLVFMPFNQLFSLFTVVSPNVVVGFIPQITFNMFDFRFPVMVMPYMYIVAAVVLILVAGFCYLLGHNERLAITPSLMFKGKKRAGK